MKNVLDFGAVGDGITKDTAAVQRAIDQGGTVYFPAGTYLCGSLYLRSQTTLELENGAVILGSPDPEDYNKPDFCPQNSVCLPEKAFGAHLIIALEVDHVAIRGGKIDGNRAAFFDPSLYSRDDFPGWRPSQMLYFCESSHILLENVEMVNSPYWTCFLHGCTDITIRSVSIRNQKGVWNGDGLDIDCCRQVVVSDCMIDSSDDSIAIRASGKDRLLHAEGICEDIAVTNCVLRSGQAGVRLGVGNGLIRHCTFSNLVIRDGKFGICMLSTYYPEIFPAGAEGAGIADILFSNLYLNAQIPIDISSNWADKPLKTSRKEIRGITIQNVRGYGCRTSILQGNLDYNVSDLTFSDISLEITGGEDILNPNHPSVPICYLRPCAFYVAYAADVLFRNCRIRWKDETELWQQAIEAENNRDLVFTDCRFAVPRGGAVQ